MLSTMTDRPPSPPEPAGPGAVSKVLVTGALGNVGAPTVEALLAAGIGVRAADLSADRAAARFPGVDTVRLDFNDESTFAAALDGCDALFLLRPPPISRVGPTLNVLVDRAARSGVRHVVFSSVAGAERNRIVPHHRVETHLRDSGLPWTMLRPGFFAQNLGDAYRADVVEDRRLYVPAGSGRVAFIDVRDLADIAAQVFSEPGRHAGHGYHLTGPAAVDFVQVAGLLTAELGTPIRYEPATIVGYARHLRSRGLPTSAVLVQTVLHAGLRRGDAEEVDPTVERLLGRPARTLERYIADHVELWSAPRRSAAT